MGYMVSFYIYKVIQTFMLLMHAIEDNRLSENYIFEIVIDTHTSLDA